MLNFDNTYDRLYQSRKKIPQNFIKLYDILMIQLDIKEIELHIKIRHNRFVLSQDFLILFSKNSLLVNLNNNTQKSYKFFEYLKNYNFNEKLIYFKLCFKSTIQSRYS